MQFSVTVLHPNHNRTSSTQLKMLSIMHVIDSHFARIILWNCLSMRLVLLVLGTLTIITIDLMFYCSTSAPNHRISSYLIW